MLANHCNIPQTTKHYHYYIHWSTSACYIKTSISTMNLAGAYIKILTGVFISHTAQNHLVGLAMTAFLCLGVRYNG